MVSEATLGITKKNFIKVPARTEIYLVVEPSSVYKHLIPIAGTEPLSPAVVDNTCLQYVVYGKKIELIKVLNFVGCLEIDRQRHLFAFPEEFIISKFTKKDKERFDSILDGEKNYNFFQIVTQ